MSVELKHADLTDRILHAFYKKVYHRLGYGFLENVYENAMAYELRQMGLNVEQQAKINVYYEGQNVGEYFADLLVEGKVIIELKAAKNLTDDHEAQLLNYLRATPYEVGLLLNFGPKPDFRRKAYDNERKISATWIARGVMFFALGFAATMARLARL
ncbi:MAG: GxxExxY protein [Chloroflexi bacterium]|nr:GxxExxY protein [Chloroflexota bacterium]